MPKPSVLSSLITKENLQLQQRKSLGEETTESLRELILLEKLPAGLSLPERDLADAERALGPHQRLLQELRLVGSPCSTKCSDANDT